MQLKLTFCLPFSFHVTSIHIILDIWKQKSTNPFNVNRISTLLYYYYYYYLSLLRNISLSHWRVLIEFPACGVGDLFLCLSQFCFCSQISHTQDMLSLVILSITNPTRRVSMVTTAWHAWSNTVDTGFWKEWQNLPAIKGLFTLFRSLSELWGQLLLTQDTHAHSLTHQLCSLKKRKHRRMERV